MVPTYLKRSGQAVPVVPFHRSRSRGIHRCQELGGERGRKRLDMNSLINAPDIYHLNLLVRNLSTREGQCLDIQRITMSHTSFAFTSEIERFSFSWNACAGPPYIERRTCRAPSQSPRSLKGSNSFSTACATAGSFVVIFKWGRMARKAWRIERGVETATQHTARGKEMVYPQHHEFVAD